MTAQGWLLLSRPGCHLCERLHEAAQPVARELGIALEVVDVDSDPVLAARWGNEIPVLLDEAGRVWARALDPPDRVARRLRRARPGG